MVKGGVLEGGLRREGAVLGERGLWAEGLVVGALVLRCFGAEAVREWLKLF